MGDLAEVFVSVGFDSRGLVSGMGKARGMLVSGMTSIGRTAGQAFTAAFAAGATIGIAALASGGMLAGFTTKLASDAEEAGSKFGFVFGEAADKTGAALDTFAKNAGRSRYEMRAMAADIGALLGPMGLSAGKTSEMSVELTTLASDLASFFNATDADALDALRAGIIGESEPLRRFGVTLNEAKIQAEAFRLGLAKTKDGITPAVKAQAIYSLVLKETKTAQGDAIRTSNSFANSLRALQGSLTDLGTDVGQLFLPAAAEINKFLRGGVEYLRANGDAFKEWGAIIGEITRNVLTQVGEVSRSIADTLGTGLNDAIKSMTGGTAGSFRELVTQLLDSVALLTADFGKTWEFIKTGAGLAATTVAKAFVDGLRFIRDALGNTFSALPDFVKDGAGVVLDGVQSIANGVREALAGMANMVDALFNHFIDRFDKIKDRLGFLVPGVSLLPSGESLKSTAGGAAVRNAMGALNTPIDIRAMGASFSGMLDSLSARLGQQQTQQVQTLFGLLSGMMGARDARNTAAAGAALPPAWRPSEATKGLAASFGDVIGKTLAGFGRGTAAATGVAGGVFAESLHKSKPASPEFQSFAELNRSIQSKLTKDPATEAAKKTATNTKAMLAKLADVVNAVKNVKIPDLGFSD